MKTARIADVQPLDLILFRGMDPVSSAIRFFERRKVGLGEYSHAGLAVNREVLDLDCLEPGKIYVWESTLSASKGFWSKFTDQIPSMETDQVRFGVQLRDLELVLPGYMSDGGRVSRAAYLGERPPLEQVRERLLALHAEYGHAPYTSNLMNVFGVVFPELRGARDRLNRMQSRSADLANTLLQRAKKQKEFEDADHHVFCSEWVARVYDALGIIDFPDPRLAAPVHFLTKSSLFDQPQLLMPEGTDPRTLVDRPAYTATGRTATAHGEHASATQAAFLRYQKLQQRLRDYAEAQVSEVSASDDERIAIEFREETPEDDQEAERWLAEQAELDLRRARVPLAFGLEPPPLSIAMLVTGTRGDVQPFIAIGQRLQRDGHRVRLATHAEFRDFVESNGLEFYPLGGDPRELIAYMVRTGGKLLPTKVDQIKEDVPKKRQMLDEIIQSTWGACTEKDPERPDAKPFAADAVISNPPTYGHIHVAEALRIPLQIVFTMPWTPTRAFPHAMANLDFERGRDLKNWLSYGVVDALTWAGTADLVGRFRKQLGLPKLRMGQGPGLLNDATVPFCYLWSPSLVPRPDDWGDHVDVADFVFFEQASEFEPPEDLVRFLDVGDPPVYVGFGSCVVEDPEGLTRTIFDALSAAGKRGVVSAGWGGLGGEAPPDHVHLVGEVAHDWLFPRCAALCHHGGAGTTASGLRAGRPTLVVPFFGDQPFWGAMVARAGAGPRPIPVRDLTVKRLADAFRACEDPAIAERAAEIGTSLRGRDGAALAVKAFYRHLPTTADGVMSYVGFDADERKRMRAGEVVTKPLLAGLEQGIGFAMAARIERPLEEVYAACLDGVPIAADPRIRAFGMLGDRDAQETDFQEAGYGADEAQEVAALLRTDAAGPFNLSAAEHERFRELGRRFPEETPSQEAIDAVNAAVRALLLERQHAYRSAGLAGIAPYARARGQETRPDELLRVAIAPDAVIADEFPDFYRALLDYPSGADAAESRFFWTKQEIDGRPIFSLDHHLYLPGADVAVLTARSYYVNRDLDALEILGGLVREDDATILLFSQKAAGAQLAGALRGRLKKKTVAHAEAAATRIVKALRGSGDATPA